MLQPPGLGVWVIRQCDAGKKSPLDGQPLLRTVESPRFREGVSTLGFSWLAEAYTCKQSQVELGFTGKYRQVPEHLGEEINHGRLRIWVFHAAIALIKGRANWNCREIQGVDAMAKAQAEVRMYSIAQKSCMTCQLEPRVCRKEMQQGPCRHRGYCLLG